jgi:CBS domain containing-hemolysin-like protein
MFEQKKNRHKQHLAPKWESNLFPKFNNCISTSSVVHIAALHPQFYGQIWPYIWLQCIFSQIKWLFSNCLRQTLRWTRVELEKDEEDEEDEEEEEEERRRVRDSKV